MQDARGRESEPFASLVYLERDVSHCLVCEVTYNCLAFGLDSTISYPFMLLGQGMASLPTCPISPSANFTSNFSLASWYHLGTWWGLLRVFCRIYRFQKQQLFARWLRDSTRQLFLFRECSFPPHFHSVCSTLCSLFAMKRRLSLWIGKFCLKYCSCFSLQLLRSLLNSVFLVALLIFPCPAATPAPLLYVADLTLQKQSELIFDGF